MQYIRSVTYIAYNAYTTYILLSQFSLRAILWIEVSNGEAESDAEALFELSRESRTEETMQ